MTGCAASVLPVVTPTPPNDLVPICDRLNDRLPNLLERLQSRPTRPRSSLVHAWGGRYPVVLRCGVPTPPGYSDSSPFTAQVNGVTWFQHVAGSIVTWTAIRHDVNIELAVPKHYQGQGAFLVDIGNAIQAAGID
jgi:hypothetical protein